MNRRRNRPAAGLGSRPRRGFVLVVVMVLLIAVAWLALASLGTASLAQRMAGAEHDHALALRAAQAALRDARRDIDGLRADGSPCPAGATGCRREGERPIAERSGGPGAAIADAECAQGQCEYALDRDRAPWRRFLATGCAADAVVAYGRYTAAAPIAEVAEAPCYLFEIARVAGPTPDGRYLIRITARGSGLRGSSVVLLQQTLLRENR